MRLMTTSLYAQADIIEARAHLHHVTIGEAAQNLGLNLVQEMEIHSHRAEVHHVRGGTRNRLAGSPF